MKTQVKAIWSILAMTTIWLTINTGKINNYAEEQRDIDSIVNSMVERLEDRIESEEDTQDSFTEEYTGFNALSFDEAFAEARDDFGADAVFVWRGEVYTTDYAETNEEQKTEIDFQGSWVQNADDTDDYCNTNNRDECGICNGLGKSTWFADRDGDGLGDIGTNIESCEQPPLSMLK